MLRKRKGFMIRTLDIRCNAAHPELPLDTFQSFVNSPSAVRVLNVPKRIGNWNLTSVRLVVHYPDNAIKEKECVRVGNVWIGTVGGSSLSGTVQNGFMITADGKDEDGNSIVGYVLGIGNVNIQAADTESHPQIESYDLKLLRSKPEQPCIGDLVISTVQGKTIIEIWDGSNWTTNYFPTKTSQLTNDSHYVKENSAIFQQKRDKSDLAYTRVYPDTSITGWGISKFVLEFYDYVVPIYEMDTFSQTSSMTTWRDARIGHDRFYVKSEDGQTFYLYDSYAERTLDIFYDTDFDDFRYLSFTIDGVEYEATLYHYMKPAQIALEDYVDDQIGNVLQEEF